MKRWLAAVPGIVLFACMFMPAFGDATGVRYPCDSLPLFKPYLLGLLVGLAALPISMRKLAIALRVVLHAQAALVAWVLLWAMMLSPLFGVILLLPTGVILAIAGFERCDERAAVRAVLATATFGLLMFGPSVFDEHALYGTYVAAAASVAMFAGGLAWHRSIGLVIPEDLSV